MVRHTTSAGASIRTSRSITRPGISIRSLLRKSATNGSRSRHLLQPSVAYVLIRRTPGPGYGMLIRCTCCGRPMTDLVLVNANVLTMDPNRPRATSVAIAQGRITALDEVPPGAARSEEHTSELQSHVNLVCRLLLEKKKKKS